MIPKKIHYCWFGGNPLDETSLKCIESWKKYFPDYEIIQWNESNFDITQMKFMQDAYAAKKWAFVSDVARLLIIYQYGGIYFDTDVEVIASYEDILRECGNGFLGFEKTQAVATGLGFGAVAEHPFIKQLLEIYEKLDYNSCVHNLAKIACPILTTDLMKENGYAVEDRRQECCGFTVYPSEYFSPLDFFNSGKLYKTRNTHSIHWYNASWNTIEEKKRLEKERKYRRIFGEKLGDRIYGVITCAKQEGVIPYIKRHLK